MTISLERTVEREFDAPSAIKKPAPEPYAPVIFFKQLMEESTVSVTRKGDLDSSMSSEKSGSRIHLAYPKAQNTNSKQRKRVEDDDEGDDDEDENMTLQEAMARIRILEDVCGHLNN